MSHLNRMAGSIARWLVSTKLLWIGGSIGSLLRKFCAIQAAQIPALPDSERLWRSVSKDKYDRKNRCAKRSAFRDKRGPLSVDLAKFSSLEKSRRGYRLKQFPEDAGLVEITIESANRFGAGGVHHVPIDTPEEPKHYCHCEFRSGLEGENDQLLADASKMLIHPRFERSLSSISEA